MDVLKQVEQLIKSGHVANLDLLERKEVSLAILNSLLWGVSRPCERFSCRFIATQKHKIKYEYWGEGSNLSCELYL